MGNSKGRKPLWTVSVTRELGAKEVARALRDSSKGLAVAGKSANCDATRRRGHAERYAPLLRGLPGGNRRLRARAREADQGGEGGGRPLIREGAEQTPLTPGGSRWRR